MSRVRRAPTLTVPMLNKNKLSHRLRQRQRQRRRRRFLFFIFTSHSLSLPCELPAIITTMATHRRSCKRRSKVCYVFVCVCVTALQSKWLLLVLLMSKWFCVLSCGQCHATHTHAYSCTLFVTAILAFSNICFVLCSFWSVRLGMCLSISVLIIELPSKTMPLALCKLYSTLTLWMCVCMCLCTHVCVCFVSFLYQRQYK